MSDEQAVAAGIGAQQNLLDTKAGIFLFDLKNEATEHGFKSDESWNLQLATEAELKTLKKTNHPVISLRLQTHVLLKVYQQVKSRLKQPLSKMDHELNAGDLNLDEKDYLVAYPARNAAK